MSDFQADAKYFLSIYTKHEKFTVDEDGDGFHVSGSFKGPGQSVGSHGDNDFWLRIQSYYVASKSVTEKARSMFRVEAKSRMHGRFTASANESPWMGYGNDPHAKLWVSVSLDIKRMPSSYEVLTGTPYSRRLINQEEKNLGAFFNWENIGAQKLDKTVATRDAYFGFDGSVDYMMVVHTNVHVQCRGESHLTLFQPAHPVGGMRIQRVPPRLYHVKSGEGTLSEQ